MMIVLSLLTMMANGDCQGRAAQVYPVYPDGGADILPRDAVLRVECRTDAGDCTDPTAAELRRVADDEVVPLTMACHPANNEDTHCTLTPNQLLEAGELYELEWSNANYDGFGVRFEAEACGLYEAPVPVLFDVSVGSTTPDDCGPYRIVAGQVSVPDAGDGSTVLRVYEGDQLVYTTKGGETNPTEFRYRIGTDKTEVCLYGVLEAGDGTLSAPSALACGDESGPTDAPIDAPAPAEPSAGPSRGECVDAPPTDTAAHEPTDASSDASAATSKSDSGCSTAPGGWWMPRFFERRRSAAACASREASVLEQL